MIVAIGAAFLAVWLWFPERGRPERLTLTPQPMVKSTPSVARPVGAGMLVLLVIAGVFGGMRGAVLMALILMVMATALVLGRRYRARRTARLRAAEVAAGCATLAAEVRAGRAAVTSLEVVAEDHAAFRPVTAASQVGAAVAESLRQCARVPGQADLVQLARAWEVAQRTGAPLAPILDAVAAGLRANQAVARTTVTELAASRATGQLLGVLPVVGIGLGFVLGGNPIDFLVNSRFGLGFLVGGVALTCAGLLWSDRLGDPR